MKHDTAILFTMIIQCQTNSIEQVTINFQYIVNLVASYNKEGILENYSNQ